MKGYPEPENIHEHDKCCEIIQELVIERTKAQNKGMTKTKNMYDKEMSRYQRRAIELKPTW